MRLNILLIIFLLLNISINAQIEWMSMNEALDAQEKKPKKIFVDVYTEWCGPCKMMDKNTFTNDDVVEYINKHFYAVKFNAEGTEKVQYKDFNYTNPNYDPKRKGRRNSQHFFANALKVSGYPTVVFFDEKSDVISPVVGYKTPEQLEIYLKMIATDKYKKIKSAEDWKRYQKSFESTFED
ncbi:thioredoxin family protein [Psychroflexus aestuariivivens]|uniref:thioredoxin family protein n=1 Tax=Psychroflexus aestuariivivens TaxID=1795040 RepID=UPI000FD7F55E|nr:thioredoxin fold domain-containing protein [Psychroflexus aestuariivivens]